VSLRNRSLGSRLLTSSVPHAEACGQPGFLSRQRERPQPRALRAHDRPPLAGALSWARGVQLALLPRFARKHVAPAASRRRPTTACHKTPPASGRRVPRACEASSASRTIRSLDSAARSAGSPSSTGGKPMVPGTCLVERARARHTTLRRAGLLQAPFLQRVPIAWAIAVPVPGTCRVCQVGARHQVWGAPGRARVPSTAMDQTKTKTKTRPGGEPGRA
jgi:hypothetical protein